MRPKRNACLFSFGASLLKIRYYSGYLKIRDADKKDACLVRLYVFLFFLKTTYIKNDYLKNNFIKRQNVYSLVNLLFVYLRHDK